MRWLYLNVLILVLLVGACVSNSPSTSPKPAPVAPRPCARAPEPTTPSKKPDVAPIKKDELPLALKARAVDDRVRKLCFLDGELRWEVRALDQWLRREKSLKYQGYFFAADSDWTQPTSTYSEEVKKQVRPLVRPFREDFSTVVCTEDFEKLGYDVIILGDVDIADSRWDPDYSQFLEDWVRKGGGLIFLCGQRHNPRSYSSDVALMRLMPVELADVLDLDRAVNTTVMKYYRLTESGNKVEMTKLLSDAPRARLFGEMRETGFNIGELNGFYWHVPATKAKVGAHVLAEESYPLDKREHGTPILVTMDVGEGRVLFVGVDETFRMRETVGDFYFGRFWRNAIMHVARN
ncbi:MAG: hypothetical protein IT462_01985 [Planctomycetes bacterium]|nr:hypothetical protein [Planctomycetota bacterium]